MKIRSVEFVTSVADPGGDRPRDLPQIAFSGRSNVGKSSLINVLLRRTRKKIARVSQEPGKTRMLNFYRVNDRFYLVDLPGFGFARVPAKMREKWRRLIEGYLEAEPGLRGIVHLMDIRRGTTPMDVEMIDYLGTLGLPTLLVLTKADKLGNQARAETLRQVQEKLGLERDQLLLFSSKTREGRDTLLDALDGLLAEVDR